MENCIFCMIANGEVPARTVYEDETVLAFDDIAPQAPTHFLVIPKQHFDNMSAAVPADVIAAIFGAVSKVAEQKGIAESGYRVIVNNGQDANQTVGHLHVHVMGGRHMSHGMVNFEE